MKIVKNCLLVIILASVVFFGNRMLQSYFGQQAKENIAVPVLHFAEAKQRAHDNEKLIMVSYSAIWCPSCRKLDQEVFANKELGKVIESNFEFAKIDHDSDEGQAFAKRHDLVGFPRVLVLNSKGDLLTELPLVFDAYLFQQNVNKLVNTVSSSPQ